MTALFRSNSSICGFKYGELHKNTTLLLGDTAHSLKTAMSITNFGVYSGSQGPTLHKVPVTLSFKYLGVYITSEPHDYISLNLSPLLGRIQDRVKVWSRLKMPLVGKVHLIIIFMPQLLYILHNAPIVVPLKIFCIINSIFRSFLWLDKPPRVKLEQLQKSKETGGLVLPNPWLWRKQYKQRLRISE